MEQVLEFLRKLKTNNNREWFNAHKEEYDKARGTVDTLAAQLIDGIAKFDGSIRRLTVKDCTYRIYRGIRFSRDKSPYKTHMAIFICPGGKKSCSAGYYFHIEPRFTDTDGTTSGGHCLVTGLYRPEPAILYSAREEVCYNGETFLNNINNAKGFTLAMENPLKRIPTGFPADSPYAEYLKLKEFYLEKVVDDDFLLSPRLLENTLEAFESTYSFNKQLNMAVDYALENSSAPAAAAAIAN